MKKFVIICGQIRKNPNLFSSLNVLYKLKKNGFINDIIISTWDYEKESIILKKIINKYKIKVIYSSETNELKSVYGNLFLQFKNIEDGLNNFENNDWVLKTRIEYEFNESFLINLFSKKNTEFLVSEKTKNILKYKIWINWAEMTKPFYIEDSVFYGRVGDLKKFISYDKIQDCSKWHENVGQGLTHIRKFIIPFKNNEIFKKYYSTKENIPFNINKGHKRFPLIIEKIKKDPFYSKLLAYYYTVLNNYFYIYTEKNMSKFKQPYTNPKNFDIYKFSENFNLKNSYLNNNINCYDSNWIKNILNCSIKNDYACNQIYINSIDLIL